MRLIDLIGTLEERDFAPFATDDSSVDQTTAPTPAVARPHEAGGLR